MALTNKERQARHRARLKGLAADGAVTASAMEQLVDRWAHVRVGLDRQLELLEGGMQTSTNHVDDTAETIARVRGHIADYDRLIAKYGSTDVPVEQPE